MTKKPESMVPFMIWLMVLLASMVGMAIIVSLRDSAKAQLKGPESEDIQVLVKRLSAQLASLDEEVASLKGTLGSKELKERIDRMESQLGSIQQLMSVDDNAMNALTVARMKEEFLARKSFEKNFDEKFAGKWKEAETKLNRTEDKLNRTEDKLDNIQLWIWASLVTAIASLIAVSLLLLRRLTQVISTLDTGPSMPPAPPATGD